MANTAALRSRAPVRVGVIDGHNLFRAGIIALLDACPEFSVVGQGSSGGDAIALVREQQPDIILLDVELPGPGILSVVRHLAADSARTGIVVLAMHDDPHLLLELVEAGAAGYVHKSADRAELSAAIGRAARHDDNVLLCVSRGTLSRMVRSHVLQSLLSGRELQVLVLLSDAKSNREIARELGIRDGTVKRHLTNLYGKLGATSRLDAVRQGRALGLLQTPRAPDRDDRVMA